MNIRAQDPSDMPEQDTGRFTRPAEPGIAKTAAGSLGRCALPMQPRVPDGLTYGSLLHAPAPGEIIACPARYSNGLNNEPLQSWLATADTTATPKRHVAGLDKADRHAGLKAA